MAFPFLLNKTANKAVSPGKKFHISLERSMNDVALFDDAKVAILGTFLRRTISRWSGRES